jgi:hypothetical protein
MYLAANGKIYITSGSGVQHIHEMNYPDSAGTACDVQQHAISLGYAQLRAVPNHPNYYLGAADGTICDSLGLNSVAEQSGWDMRMQLKPNPTVGKFEISYLLPPNQSGLFEVLELTGKRVFSMPLPPWSTLQQVDVSYLSGGIYTAVVTSGWYRSARKVVVVKE